MKERFTKKINIYRDQLKKTYGDKDYNKIFQYYLEISKVFNNNLKFRIKMI